MDLFERLPVMKKVLFRNVLDKYLGQFLLEKLSIDQFTIELLSGKGIIYNLDLDVHALNELAEQKHFPFKFINGFIEEIKFKIEWKKLFSKNCHIGLNITGLSLTLHPKHRQEDVSLVDSMIDSMSTSLQIGLAQKCFSEVEEKLGMADYSNQECNSSTKDDSCNKGLEEVVKLAEAINAILNGLQLRFIDTSIRLQYEPDIRSGIGIAIDIDIGLMDYFNEAGMDKDSKEQDKDGKNDDEVASKKLVIQGIDISTEEFYSDVSNYYDTTKYNHEDSLSSNTFDKDINTSIDLSNRPSSKEGNFQSERILLIKICGQQEIKFRLGEEVNEVIGPKVQIEANFGSFVGFITPRQINLLIELFEAFLSPEQMKMNNETQMTNQKQMNQNDYNNIEIELQRNFQRGLNLDNYSNQALNDRETWSVPTVGTSSNFYSLDNQVSSSRNTPLTSSQISDHSEFEKSVNTQVSGKTEFSESCDNKSNNEITLSLKIKFRSITLLLLHEDLLVSSDKEGEIVTDSSLAYMHIKTKEFFDSFGSICHFDNYLKEFKEIKLNTLCLLSHIRLITSPFNFELIEKTFGRKWERGVEISLGWTEIIENVYNSLTDKQISSQILSFPKNDITNDTANDIEMSSPKKSNIGIIMKETCLIGKTGTLKSKFIPTTTISLVLDDCHTEIDFSIIDRLNTLLSRQAIIKVDETMDNDSSNLDNNSFYFDQIVEDELKLDKKMNVQIVIPILSAKIFFPIPDMRPLSDIERLSWWERNIRKETLHLKFEDFIFDASINSQLTCGRFEVKCNDLHVLFQNNEDCSPISLVRASVPNDSEKGFDLIRIVLQVFPLQSQNDLEDSVINENLMNKSMMGFLEDITNKDPNIFTKRKIVSYQNEEMNEITLPSSKEEINRFIEDTLQNVQFKLNINLPQVQFIIPSKHILELLYNRLISDLLLWTPCAPVAKSGLFDINEGLKKDLTFQQFKFCKNFRNADYMEEEMTIPDIDSTKSSFPTQTYFTALVSIGNLIGYMNSPCRDSSGKIIQNKQGELLLSTSDCTIFVASGYKGKMDTCLNSITTNKISLSHDPCVKKDISPIYLKSSFTQTSKKGSTIVLYPNSLMKMERPSDSVNNSDCLTVCIKTEFNILKNEKILQFAGGLNNVTLNYIMTKPYECWLSQLQDMFTLEDYPIAGYSLPTVITELNFELNHCSIFYEPLNLSVKSVLTPDSVCISSNMNLEGDCSVLLIIIEDAGLFLSQDIRVTTIDLKDYICVAHVGLIEICAKLDGIKSELTVSNDMLHIRTCSDSFKVLLELLTYIANEGDLVELSDKEKVVISPSESKEVSYSSKVKILRDLKDHSIVEARIQDAMMEQMDAHAPYKPDHGRSIIINDVNEFHFPGEGNKFRPKPCYIEEDANVIFESYVEDRISALRDASQDHDFSKNSKTGGANNIDNEYCMLHKIPGSGIKSTSGLPQAHSFWTQNNFISIDIDSTPFDIDSTYYEVLEDSPLNCLRKENETMAIKINMIQDVSVTWYMYGGNDFKIKCDLLKRSNIKSSTKRESNFEKKKLNKVVFTDNDACIISDTHSESHLTSHKNANLKWYILGGNERNHDVLLEIQISKIKFLQEIFPEKSKILSQNIFNIYDFEIRDKLVSSQINKFLYQYYTEACPRQAKSNMVTVIATTVKSDPVGQSPETALTVSLRPMRLNIDQDSLIFLIKFLNEILSVDLESEKSVGNFMNPPVMSINTENVSYSSTNHTSELNDDTNMQDSSQPTYFKSFVFSPDVPIKIDYHGKHIDINSEYGPLVGLIFGLGNLNNSEITLKRIEFLNGVLGVNKLIASVSDEWLNDIRSHQYPSILGGVGPLHSFVQLANGIKDLIWLPIEQYHTDGRILRGIQKGTSSFASSSAYATLDLTGKFVACIQDAAETMYDMVSAGPSVRHKYYRRKNLQPKDIREGVSSAVGLVRHGLGDTANTIWKVAAEEHHHKGMSGAVGGVLRQIPPSVMQPIILASEATCTVIGGLKNQLVPDARKEATEKWKV